MSRSTTHPPVEVEEAAPAAAQKRPAASRTGTAAEHEPATSYPGGMQEQVTAGFAPTAGLVLLDRYVLDDRVGGSDESPIWRGTDTRLRRAVSVQMLPGDDARADALREGARRAASFDDRRAVPVLDFGVDPTSHLVVVVSEWVPSIGYGDYIARRGGDRLAPAEAADVTLELARCLTAAHAHGVQHGVLQPNSIAITESGEVRLRGLGIAAALAPDTALSLPDAASAVAADIHGVGSVLYAGLTGRWPDGADDHLPEAARLPGGALPWPSRVVAEVPAALDDVAARSLRECSLPKGRAPFTDLAALTAALTAATDAPRELPPMPSRPRRGTVIKRTIGIILGLALAIVLAVIGVHLASGSLTKAGTPAKVDSVGLGNTAPTGQTSSPPVAPLTTTIAIGGAADIDPFGANSSENPGLVKYSHDGDPATAWTTLQYNDPNMGGKTGVGIRFDLGTVGTDVTFHSVNITLVGNGTNLALYTGETKSPSLTDYKRIRRAQGAPTTVTLSFPKGVTTRYLVVLLTKLPPYEQGYKGGIAEISIKS